MYLTKVAKVTVLKAPGKLIVVEIRMTEDRRNLYGRYREGDVNITKGMFPLDPGKSADDSWNAPLKACLDEIEAKHGPCSVKTCDPKLEDPD